MKNFINPVAWSLPAWSSWSASSSSSWSLAVEMIVLWKYHHNASTKQPRVDVVEPRNTTTKKKTTHSFPSSVFEISSRFSHFIWLKKNGRYAGPCYLKEFYWTRWSPPSQPNLFAHQLFHCFEIRLRKKPGFLGHVVVIMENLMDMCTLQEKSILNLISNPGIFRTKPSRSLHWHEWRNIKLFQ